MNKIKIEIVGKKAPPTYLHASIDYYPLCSKGQFLSEKKSAE